MLVAALGGLAVVAGSGSPVVVFGDEGDVAVCDIGCDGPGYAVDAEAATQVTVEGSCGIFTPHA